MIIIVKHGATVYREGEWYRRMPDDLVPGDVQVQEDDSNNKTLHLSLERGRHPVSWTEPGLPEAIDRMWHDTDRPSLPLRPEDYAAYIGTRVQELALHDLITPYRTECLRNAILSGVYTPVCRVHGDLTLENVIRRTDGTWCFTDPGDPRGLPCQELDEAKMLQSAEGWDCRRGTSADTSYPIRLPFKATKQHYLLLVTHYIRILCHDHPSDLLAWTRNKITKTVEAIGL